MAPVFGGTGGTAVYYQNTAPLNPSPGDFWFDTSGGTVLNFRVGGAWVAISIPTAALDTLSNSVSVLSQAVSVLSQTVSAISVRMDTISNAVSVVSQALSVLSQQQSVLSNAVSVLSQAVSVLSNAVSVVSQAQSVLSQKISVLSQKASAMSIQLQSAISIHNALSARADTMSQQISVLSTALSVLSAGGIANVQMKVVAGSQAAASAVVKVSGLSVSLALSTYQLDGMLLFSTSGTGSVDFGFSTSTAAFGAFAGEWRILVSVVSTVSVGATGGLVIGTFNTQNTTQAVAAVGSTGIVQWARVNAIVRVTTAGSIQMKATPVTGGPLTILQGSYLRAYLLG